jgi:hypothetical protein
VHQATGRARDTLRSVRSSGEAVLGLAGDGASGIADQAGAVFTRYPLLIGAAGALAGALLAALLPVTRIENRLFGDTREQLWNRAQAAGREAITQVRDIVSQGTDHPA